MEHLNVFVTILGAVIVVFGLASKRLEKSPLPPTVLALALGVAIGPVGTGWVDLSALGERAHP